jgi:hypothetical protein
MDLFINCNVVFKTIFILYPVIVFDFRSDPDPKSIVGSGRKFHILADPDPQHCQRPSHSLLHAEKKNFNQNFTYYDQDAAPFGTDTVLNFFEFLI